MIMQNKRSFDEMQQECKLSIEADEIPCMVRQWSKNEMTQLISKVCMFYPSVISLHLNQYIS